MPNRRAKPSASRTPTPTASPGQPSRHDHALEQTILALLHARGPGKTICPSEAARVVAASDLRSLWQPLMVPARAAARRLVASGHIEITQHGEPVDASAAKGPIRLRLRPPQP